MHPYVPVVIAGGGMAMSVVWWRVRQLVRDIQRIRALERRGERRRSLCPACLCIDTAEVLCAGCGHQLAPTLVPATPTDTSQRFRSHQNDGRALCPQCLRVLRDQVGQPLQGYVLRCGECKSKLEDSTFTRVHKAMIVGTLFEADFHRLYQAAFHDPGRPRREPEYWKTKLGRIRRFAWIEGRRVICILCLADLSDARELPHRHAARAVSAIWTGAEELEPLRLSRSIDAYFRGTDCEGERAAPVLVCTAAPRIGVAVRNLLRQRFARGRCGVTAEAFLRVCARRSRWD